MSETRRGQDGGSSRLSTDDLRDLTRQIMVTQPPADDTDLIDQIEALERAKSAACALQAKLTDDLAQQRPTTRGHPAASVACEVALARHESPHAGRTKVRLARALIHDLPHTYAALCHGDINETRAQIIVAETADLTRADRISADAQIADRLRQLGDKKLTHAIRRIVLTLDDHAATNRRNKVLRNRRVTGRLRRDGTAEITAIVSEIHYATIIGSLDTHAATRRRAGDPRTKAQIMSDTAAERLAGLDEGANPPVAVQLVISAETLLGNHHDPAHLPGHGPIPASVARRIIALADPLRSTIRRLFATPDDGTLIAMESTQRCFPPDLRGFILLRDDLCRTPWCNAPARHADHVQCWCNSGPTTLINGQGLCEWCNYLKDDPGWTYQTGTQFEAHQVTTTTPTGHRPPATDINPANPAPHSPPHTATPPASNSSSPNSSSPPDDDLT